VLTTTAPRGNEKLSQYWHKDCFRCPGCQQSLAEAMSTGELRYMGNGWPTCSECIYHCAICTKKIYGTDNYMDKNVPICGRCFECCRCRTKLNTEDPRFRRLKNNAILCIPCVDQVMTRKRKRTASESIGVSPKGRNNEGPGSGRGLKT